MGIRDLYNKIYGGRNSEPDYSETYEEVYDEDGNEIYVTCNYCSATIMWKNGNYVCPECGAVMERSELFNAIGAEPPGPECVYCNNLYPGCVICPYGYIDEEI